MARTYRKPLIDWWGYSTEPKELVDGWEPGNEIAYYCCGNLKSWKRIDPKSANGKRILAKQKRDKVIRFKEPGPSWFRRIFTQRPYRQSANKELHKFIEDEDYEPMILSKPKLEYWT